MTKRHRPTVSGYEDTRVISDEDATITGKLLFHQHHWVGQFNGDGYRCECGAVTSGRALGKTKLRHRVLVVPQIHYASITKEN